MRERHSCQVLSLTGLLALFSAALAGCAEPEQGETYAYVFDELRVLTSYENVDGVTYAEGFDIDGSVGPAPMNTCRSRTQDHVAPDGRSGIDNALATPTFGFLADAIAAVQGGGDGTELFSTFLQTSITIGELVVLLQVDDVSSLENDDDVKLTLFIGLPADVGSSVDMRLLPGQSFSVNPDIAPVSVRTSIRDGVAVAEGLTIQATASILGIPFSLPIRQVRLRLEFHATGTITGTLGGAIPWRPIFEVLPLLGSVTPALVETGRGALIGVADTMNDETGECDAISAAIRTHAVPAFIVDQPAESASDIAAP